MKPSQLFTFLEKTIPLKLPVLIKGAPGIGKTDIIHQVCQKLGANLIVEHPVVSDPTDYKGLPFVMGDQKDHAEFLPFGSLKKLITAKDLTVYFLDDLGQATPAVQAACMQLILARRVNGHHVSPQVCFIAATNRHTDRAGVSGLLEPVKSRFVSIIELETDLEDWVDWALKNGIETPLISFVRFRPNLLHDFKPTNELKNSPCPRTIHNIDRLMKAGLPHELEYEVFSGAAGEGFAAEFIGFLKIFRNLPNPDAIIMNPNSAEIPEDPATLYAICGALAEKASKQTIGNIVKYANRLPAEFSVLLIRDSARKDKTIVNSRPFIEWANKNKNILI